MLTHISGEKTVVRETAEPVTNRLLDFRRANRAKEDVQRWGRPDEHTKDQKRQSAFGRFSVDKASFGGLLVAIAGILAGLIVEGGKLGQILQPTAAMIVFGGTIGAVLVQFPLPVVMGAGKLLWRVFFERRQDGVEKVEQLVKFANKARRDGIVSLDEGLESIDDLFLRKSLMLAIDGTEPEELRKMMELELDNYAEREERYPQVFESAGGFSPTIGIIGAVLGLIQIMQHLENIDEVGRGIAVAFVATIYGVGAANLFFLPAAGKLRIRIREGQILREMTLEGVVAILEGMNPRMLGTKLLGFLSEQPLRKVQLQGRGQ